ncbi:hypothetical protein N781_17700 [Pontibacillus halophilus JSM 076056 = DSM 19796]|uniref:Hydrolase n=1 Tax=Pontibacillus halophilus JSM 076056 = DSM 19796 TaxID=1385510 RepID=A0A0A5GM19_9BACI|nr:hypothetical protein [Pontibacillus halophilus]KGX92283.1 hypothetical protein N781_17700 [Pontibacillus halophilus JSM 076056 = DSM 19796]
MRWLSIVVIICIGLNLPTHVVADLAPLQPNVIRYAFFDLPDGESMLIQTGRGEQFLFNTGSAASEEALVGYLDDFHIHHLDAIILTNQTSETCGNTGKLMNRLSVEKLIYSGEVQQVCGEVPRDVESDKWEHNQSYELTPGISIRVLPGMKEEEMSLFIQYGYTSLLYMATGDVKAEQRMMDSYPLKAELLKVGDYASTQSPTLPLLDTIDPHLAIIYDVKGKEVNEGLMARFQESWIDVYQLKEVGTMVIQCTPDEYEILKTD